VDSEILPNIPTTEGDTQTTDTSDKVSTPENQVETYTDLEDSKTDLVRSGLKDTV
jgi:hypothetical protein